MHSPAAQEPPGQQALKVSKGLQGPDTCRLFATGAMQSQPGQHTRGAAETLEANWLLWPLVLAQLTLLSKDVLAVFGTCHPHTPLSKKSPEP